VILIIILKQIQALSKVKSQPDGFSYLLLKEKYPNKQFCMKIDEKILAIHFQET
jgi:hypothetical protein